MSEVTYFLKHWHHHTSFPKANNESMEYNPTAHVESAHILHSEQPNDPNLLYTDPLHRHPPTTTMRLPAPVHCRRHHLTQPFPTFPHPEHRRIARQVPPHRRRRGLSAAAAATASHQPCPPCRLLHLASLPRHPLTEAAVILGSASLRRLSYWGLAASGIQTPASRPQSKPGSGCLWHHRGRWSTAVPDRAA